MKLQKKELSFRGAVIFTMFSKYLVVIFNIIINAILARLILPGEFGIVAIITVFSTFFAIIADIGIGEAIIQNKSLEKKEMQDIFSFFIYLGIILAILFCGLSSIISIFYNIEQLSLLGSILSLSLLFNAFNTVPNAMIMRDKRFVEVGIRTIIANIISGSIAVIIAYSGGKYYTLVFQSVCNAIIIFLWNYLNYPIKFRINPTRSSFNKIKSYSSFLFGFHIINYFSRNLDNLIIGKVLGSAQLGYYDKAYKLMLYPIQNLTFVINPVLHPVLADYQDNRKIIYEKYICIVKILSLIGVFLSVFCFFSSREMIYLFFGTRWEDSILAFQILSISLWFQLTVSSTGAIYQSINQTKTMFQSGLLFSIIIVSLIFGGIMSKNIYGVAVAISIGYFIKFFVDYYMLITKGFQYSMIEFLKNFISELWILVIFSLIMLLLNRIKLEFYFTELLFKGIISLIIYIAILYLTGQIKYFKIIFSKN